MEVAKQIVDQRIRKIIDENPNSELFRQDYEKNISTAFLLLGVATYRDNDVADIICNITEGGGDGGIDAAFLEINENAIEVTFFQAKYVRDLEKNSNYPANAVEKAVATVKSVFDPQAQMSLNMQSRAIVDQISSYIADGYIPYVNYVMLNNGGKWNEDGQNKIDNEFMGQAQVKFIHYNHDSILDVINRKKVIDAKIRFSGKAVGEQLMYKPAVIGRVRVTEIHGLMTEHKDVLLERNIRRFLGSNNIVNKDIKHTLLNDSGNFFFFNNGITMVCSKLLYNELQKEDWIVQTENLQIINGGQTCHTIHETLTENPDKDFTDAYVLVRMYAVGNNEQVAAGIIKATNTQSPIDLRDLHANEPEQEYLEIGANDLGYIYKRKRDAVLNTNADTITSSVAAEAVYTVWREKPHLLSRKKSELFSSENYNAIFGNLNAPQMIIAVLIYRFCDNMRRKISTGADINAQRAFSQYLISVMMSKRLLADCKTTKEKIDHNNFESIRLKFDHMKEEYYEDAERRLISSLIKEFGCRLIEVDGRSLSAIFRRFEFIEKVLGNLT